MLFWFSGFVALGVFLSGRICFGMVCCHTLYLLRRRASRVRIALHSAATEIRWTVLEKIDDRLLMRMLGLRCSTREHRRQRPQLVNVDGDVCVWCLWRCEGEECG
jgi:hypothetical protein